MNSIERFLSRPAAKPYRSHKISKDRPVYLDENGHLDFEPDDVENPKNWSAARRWYVTVVATMLVVNSTFASSNPTGSLDGIAKDLHVSTEAAGLVITLFLLGYSFGPLVFAPLSEFYGRRYVFYITFIGYIAFNFLCAFAPNFGALLVGRFLTGTFISAPQSNVPGVLADVWPPLERGNAMALYSAMTFAGPALSPVISGFLELKLNWRWGFFVLLWMGGITFVLMLTLPETLPSRVLTNKARRIRRAKVPGFEDVQSPAEASGTTLSQLLKIALLRPWTILFDPIAFLCAIYLSIVYTLLYMLFTIYPIVFQQKRGWNTGVGELPLIGVGIGACFGAGIVYAISRKERAKMLQGWQPKPEQRLLSGMIGGPLFCVTMFWFGWTANFNSIHWIVPTIAGAFLAAAITLIFTSFINYLTDTYLMYAASAIAANTVCRSAAASTAPLFTEYMFKALGVGGGASLIGGVAALLALIPFAFYKYGEGIRVKSRFAPTDSKESDVEKGSPRMEAVKQTKSHDQDDQLFGCNLSTTTTADSESTDDTTRKAEVSGET